MKWQDKTRGGYPVRIYAEDGLGQQKYHGAIYEADYWHPSSWNEDGSNYTTEERYDLIPIEPERPELPEKCEVLPTEGLTEDMLVAPMMVEFIRQQADRFNSLRDYVAWLTERVEEKSDA